MLRTSTSLALIAGMALTLGLAGSASATNSLDIVWKSNGLNTIGDTLSAPPPEVTALLILRGDAIGVAGVEGGFVFDYTGAPGAHTGEGNELDARSPYFVENAGPAAKVAMGNQFAPLNTANTLLSQESNGAQHGVMTGFESATLGPGCVSCTITLGSVLFTTTANTSSDTNPDVSFSISINGSDGVLDANNVDTVDNTFGAANVLPEPIAGVFGASALIALGVLARRRS